MKNTKKYQAIVDTIINAANPPTSLKDDESRKQFLTYNVSQKKFMAGTKRANPETRMLIHWLSTKDKTNKYIIKLNRTVIYISLDFLLEIGFGEDWIFDPDKLMYLDDKREVL